MTDWGAIARAAYRHRARQPADPPFDVEAGLARLRAYMDERRDDGSYLDEHAEEGQTDGGVDLCAVCGDEAGGECGACDRPLCDRHRRVHDYESFCRLGEGCG